MDNVSEKFVKRIYELSRDEIPEKTKLKAKSCLIDYLGCVIGGSVTYAEVNEKYLNALLISGNTHVFRRNRAADLRNAVMVNAFNAHVLELDDSHRVAMTHLGAPIFSALLGVAEQLNCSLSELLKASIVGYETAIRLGCAIQPGHKKKGFHVSGTCCAAGCAMGLATLLNYSEEEMKNAFSAAITSGAGLLAVISGSSEQKPYNIANAAVSGLDAALYGKNFTGAIDILGDPRGFFHAETDKAMPEKLFSDGFTMDGIYQKLYASCRHCHAPKEAALNLKKRVNVSSDQIKKLTVKTYDLAIQGHDHRDVQSASSAKQSIPYAVASALYFGNVEMNELKDQFLMNEKVQGLMKLVSVEEDPALSKLVPNKRPAIVAMELKDGSLFEERVDYAKGEPENPISSEELKVKYLNLTQFGGIPEKKASEVYAVISEGNHPRISDIIMS